LPSRWNAQPSGDPQNQQEEPQLIVEKKPRAKKIPWMERYWQLVLLKQKHGHLQLKNAEDKTLRSWFYSQKFNYKKGSLHEYQIDLLKKIGLDLNDSGSSSKTFASTSSVLNAVKKNEESQKQTLDARIKTSFGERSGLSQESLPTSEPAADLQLRESDDETTARVPNERADAFTTKFKSQSKAGNGANTPLYSSIDIQQSLQRPNKFKIQHEEPLHQVRHLSTKPAAKRKKTTEIVPWMDRYKQLVHFNQKHGHCRVSLKNDEKLHFWVYTQRSLYKKGKLKRYQMDLLDEVDLFCSGNKESTKSHSTPPLASNSAKKNEESEGQLSAERIEILSEHGDREKRELSQGGNKQLLSKPRTEPVSGQSMTFEPRKKTVNNTPTEKPSHFTVVERSDDFMTGNRSRSKVGNTSNLLNMDPEPFQKYAIGTRVRAIFQVDGVLRSFGGSVFSFEQFEEDDGSRKWGHMIHYDDGDKEHMLEDDVAEHVVTENCKKRKAKSQLNDKQLKRPKEVSLSDRDILLEGMEAKRICSVPGETKVDFPEKLVSAVLSKKLNETSRVRRNDEALSQSFNHANARGTESHTTNAQFTEKKKDAMIKRSKYCWSDLDSLSSEDSSVRLPSIKKGRKIKRNLSFLDSSLSDDSSFHLPNFRTSSKAKANTEKSYRKAPIIRRASFPCGDDTSSTGSDRLPSCRRRRTDHRFLRLETRLLTLLTLLTTILQLNLLNIQYNKVPGIDFS
jgi:hypothetical protein